MMNAHSVRGIGRSVASYFDKLCLTPAHRKGEFTILRTMRSNFTSGPRTNAM